MPASATAASASEGSASAPGGPVSASDQPGLEDMSQGTASSPPADDGSGEHRRTAALARALSPLVWRSPAHAARKLHAFALAEHGSMLDMRLAARLTDSPARAAAYLRHADDEARHAQMFARRAARLYSESGRRGALPAVRADSEQLFERLGERDFLAFVHRGEARARAQFEAYVTWFKGQGRDLDRTLFETILVDERRHCAYTRALLFELHGEVEARRALRRVARWELGRGWLRAGRFIAERVYVAAMMVVYALTAPLSLLLRAVRPIRAGWQPPALVGGARSSVAASPSEGPAPPG